MCKLSDEHKEKLHNLGQPIEQVIDELPVKTLHRIGKRVCSTDYAVRYYNNKQHPKFHLNREALCHAIRRAWAQGAFNHREQILDILDDEGFIEEFRSKEQEVWKTIPGYSRYQVSTFGRVKSFVHRQPVVLKPVKSERGRGNPEVTLFNDDGIGKRISVGRLVAAAFIPNPDNLSMVIYIDGDTTNSHVSNLKWSNHVGENNPRTILSNTDVPKILALIDSNKLTLVEIGQRYGVSVDVISDIKRGKSFKSINKMTVTSGKDKKAKKDRHTKLNVVKSKRRKLASRVGQCKQ